MNTFCGEQITELIGQLAIFLIERIGAAFQYRHAHAEAMKHLGEFYAYRAAARHRQPPWQRGERDRLHIRNKACLLQPLDRRNKRLAAGCHDDACGETKLASPLISSTPFFAISARTSSNVPPRMRLITSRVYASTASQSNDAEGMRRP